jgi:hypothetical protein
MNAYAQASISSNTTLNTTFTTIMSPSTSPPTAYSSTAITTVVQPTKSGVTFGIVTATSFNATSDYRIKQHPIILTEQYTVDTLTPVTYFNTQLNKQDIGFIAHEVEENFPFLVSGKKDGDTHQSLNYNGIIGIAVKEIQRLKQTVQDQSNTIASLQSSISQLQAQIKSITEHLQL